MRHESKGPTPTSQEWDREDMLIIRSAAVVLAGLLLLAGCGSEPEQTQTEAAATPTAAPSSPSICTKLARTWAVHADKLDTAFLLTAQDTVEEATKSMTDATEQMEIEGCAKSLHQKAAMGDYYASVAAFESAICNMEQTVPCNAASKKWRKNGVRLIEQLKSS